MAWKDYAEQKLRKCENLLLLAFRLLKKRSKFGVMPLLDAAFEQLEPLPSLHLFPLEKFPAQVDAKERLERFRHIIDDMADRTAGELARVSVQYPDCESDQPVINRKRVGINMYLSDDDPQSLPECDNILVDMDIPLSVLADGSSCRNDASGYGHNSRLYNFILDNAWPRVNENDLLRVEAIWIDIVISRYWGIEINGHGTPRLLNIDELECLLDLPDCRQTFDGREIMLSAADYGRNGGKLLAKLLLQLNYLQKLAKRNESSELLPVYKSFMDYFELIREYFSDDDSASIYHGMPKHSRDEMMPFIYELDNGLDLLEMPVLNAAQRELGQIQQRIRANDDFLNGYNDPELEAVAIWTDFDRGICGQCRSLPLIINRIIPWSILGGGENWSEFPGMRKMNYLAHALVHDSAGVMDNLPLVNKVTLKMDFWRQIYVRIDTATQQLKGGIPDREDIWGYND